MADQETYLETSSVGKIVLRGLKKLLTEMTSVKFLLLIFVCVGIWQKFITDTVGLGVALVIIGMREVPVETIISKLTGGIQ